MMMRTVAVVRPYLAAAFVIGIGLIGYGCGDTATVNPEVQLASLKVTPGTLQPGFSGGTTQYTVNLTSDVTTVNITAQPAVSGDSVSINGQATANRTITLGAAGTTTSVNIVVSESGTNSRTYTVLLVRAGLTGNNSLQSLTVSGGTLAPAFDANIQDYTVDVANNVGSVSVTPTLDDPNATMTVNGQAAISGQPRSITLNAAGQSTLITTIVTAQNSSNKSYRITVSRGVSANNNLSGLTVSQGSLTPTFRAGTEDYTVNVASTVASVSVTPTRQDPNATITVNGQATNSGQARSITLNSAGSNTFINIEVTAQNGTQKTYSLNVNRAALGGNNNLSGLTVSTGSLSPAFNTNTEAYTLNVGSGVTSVTVTPTRQNSSATITMNGTPATSGQGRSIPLNGAGSNTLINIVVTAQNGTQNTYSINVIRAALGGNNNLSGLAVSPGTLAPAFSPGTEDYTVDVASTATSVTVTPTEQDTAATTTVNGQPTNSGQGRAITLRDAGLSTTINIVVRAPNGNQNTYVITVDRAAPTPPSGNNNLQSLTVSPGTLSPAFTAARIAYTVSDVGSSATSILVTAAPQDSGATVTINTQGGNSRSIPLPGGPSSTEIEVSVIAPNGNDRTYLITVNQPAPSAPPAPASAPDLTPESDSGFLPGQNSDNITNDLTPAFFVPQPAAGETPSLYVGIGANPREKVQTSFDSATNTLTVTNPLPGGEYDISVTSTVTNAASLESPQSQALSVHIDNVAGPAPTGQ